MDFRPILLVVGFLLIILAVAMCLPAAADMIAGHRDWQVFIVAAGLTLFVGVAMALACRAGRFRLSVRQAFVMTTLAWTVLTLFAALPFMFSELRLSFTDAVFEAMSGITTTGATVIVGLDTAPPGILLWRAILQSLGGLGIMVVAVAVLPMLGVGGMQMFRIAGFETGEKLLPRAGRIGIYLAVAYYLLTFSVAAMLYAAGMTAFEAIIHAMTALSTGGFSTSDASIGHFDSALIDYILIFGMIAGALPFMLYVRFLQGDWRSLVRDSQVHWFLVICGITVSVVTLFLVLQVGYTFLTSLRLGAFNVISTISGTGFVTADYGLWGAFAWPIFTLLMVIGGCTGSASGGVKIFRFQMLWAATDAQFRHLIRPHGIIIPSYGGRPIPDVVVTSVLSFFFMYGLVFAVIALGLGMLGLDYGTAITSAATTLGNVGPGLGPIVGPAGTFKPLSDSATWLLTIAMLLGRLELFTVLLLLSPAFWRG